MLAASTTAAIVLALVGLLIFLGLLVVGMRVVVIAVRLLFRLLAWPFRALRPKPPTGLGADYEAMIRQQPRGRPVTVTGGSDAPYWPPPQYSHPMPQPQARVESQIVLPPPPYREREPETEPVASPVPTPSRWERIMRTPRRTAGWALLPLAWLGLWFIVSKPLVGTDWVTYGVGIVVAVGVAVWTKRNYHAKILWRAERSAVVWQRWGRRDDSLLPPVEVRRLTDYRPGN